MTLLSVYASLVVMTMTLFKCLYFFSGNDDDIVKCLYFFSGNDDDMLSVYTSLVVMTMTLLSIYTS